MNITKLALIIVVSCWLTICFSVVMYDSVEGLGFEQTDAGYRGGIRG